MKTCTRCNCEKPEGDFRVKRIGADGLPRLHSLCRHCEWGSRSDEARERKRERDRVRVKTPEYRARFSELKKQPHRVEWMQNYQAKYAEKEKSARFEASAGRHLFFMVRQCAKCGRKDSLRVRPIRLGMQYCKRCVISVLGTGKSKPKTSITCLDCKESFVGAHNASRCSMCKKRHERLTHADARDHRGRAMKYGVPYESIKRGVVYDRDGWMCYLCGCKVFTSSTYHPQQATLDCVAPMSKGGGYTYSNVKTCCMMCNASKSDRLLSVGQQNQTPPTRHLRVHPSPSTSPAHHDVHHSEIVTIFRQA